MKTFDSYKAWLEWRRATQRCPRCAGGVPECPECYGFSAPPKGAGS